MLENLLSTPTAQLGRASRFLVFQIKLWTHCARLLKKNRAGQQAAALSYHTIFGLVPLSVVMLLIFQSFDAYSDIGDKVRNIAYEQLHLSTIEYPDPANAEETIRLTEHMDNFVVKVFEGLNEGTIAFVSAILIIWAALALLGTIERSFNNIWGVGRGRGFIHRIINYWALLTLGPLLIGVAIYITTRYAMLGRIQQTVMSNVAPAVLSYVIATVAFFLLYFVLPNTKVEAKAAIWGAAVAVLVWTIAKWGFGMYVTKFIPFSKVYGIMGLIPLGVLWIYLSWLIVLFGLELTFTTQHLKSLDAAEIAAANKREEHFIANDITVINIMREIAAGFESSRAPVELEVISSKLDIPAEFVEKILNHIIRGGLVVRASEPRDGFLPAREPADIKLSQISEVVAEVGYAQSPTDAPEGLRQISRSQRELLSQYNVKEILEQHTQQQ